MNIRENTCNTVVIIGARTSPRISELNVSDDTCCRVNKLQNRERLNVPHKVGGFVKMAGTHNFVDLKETKGNVEPCKGRNGIVIGEVRFTPCYLLGNREE